MPPLPRVDISREKRVVQRSCVHSLNAMTTPEHISVATCITAIIRTYSEGADLVARIRGKRSARLSVQIGSVQQTTSQELQASLNRGAEAIQSQFRRDASRFGEEYEIGDRQAQSPFYHKRRSLMDI